MLTSVKLTMKRSLRVAFFTDSFHEVNGVALTSRQFESFAEHRKLPFFSVHAGADTRMENRGSVTRLELQRGVAALPLDHNLSFDLALWWKHRDRVISELRSFAPDLIHVTGPGDFGMLGAYFSHRLRVPLVASWHTNLHEYAARRLERLLSFIPAEPRSTVVNIAERQSLFATAQFYRIARLLFAPNQELVDLLSQRTGKLCFLMQRGVDAELYQPDKRDPGKRPFTIGYVGRLTSEKNVRFLADIEAAMIAAGITDYRFVIAGAGAEEGWLRQNLRRAELAGILEGDTLARAYANMDVFAFPSQTDTFGNVILESLASGVPAVVTASGGPKFLVRDGVSGFVARGGEQFTECILRLHADHRLRESMREAARAHACSMSWDRVFEKVYEAYEFSLPGRNDYRAAG